MSSLPPQLEQYYSTEIVSSDGIRSRIFSDGIRKRIETYNQGSIPTITITRPDLGVNWLLILDSKQYQEFQRDSWYRTFEFDLERGLEWQEEGLESIEGVEYVRYRGLYKFSELEVPYQLRYVDQNNGFRSRLVIFDKTGSKSLTVDCYSLSPEPPDPKMFDLPQGYTKEPE
jgi:hypothetical protein